ncbi:hypothetical protein LPJ64_001508 [Coemansia asiatica]|uniref:Uncharacterized protein n=1 Tax=Coemansia asiatica TaxID=1052880 RepID=A0A9W8CJW5_9FUNG|nr:hypothetical protein LPJ64_001508 [Coemansia asiatica]
MSLSSSAVSTCERKVPVVVAAEPRFSIRQATYAINPLTAAATRLPEHQQLSDSEHMRLGATIEGTSYISILVMSHGNQGMVWVWARVSSMPPSPRNKSALSNLVLAMPPRAAHHSGRASATYLVGGDADDPTADVARRLTARFKRPIFVSLSNVNGASAAVVNGSVMAMMSLDGPATSPAERLAVLERCLLAELKSTLTSE